MNDDAEIPLRLRIVRSPELRDPLGVDSSDQSIPMLTEVMDFQKIDLEEPDLLSLDALENLANNDREWSSLKKSVQDKVLESLLEKSDEFLAREFQERVKPLLERTVTSMVQDLHIHLEQVLRDAVASAITEELNKLQSPQDLKPRSPIS